MNKITQVIRLWLRALPQCIHECGIHGQAIMIWAEDNIMNKGLGFENMVDNIISNIEKNGLLSIDRLKCGSGSLSAARKQEIIAAYNRYKNLKIII